jgi:acetoin utilization protein AcuB
MIAQDIMTKDPLTVSETTSIGDALTSMSERGVRHLPVVRGAEVVGILSDRDLRNLGVSMVSDMYGYDRLRARLSQPVAALMTGGVVTVDRDVAVSEVVDVLIEEKLSAIPVVEPGTQELVGIISYLDVLHAVQPLLEGDEEG